MQNEETSQSAWSKEEIFQFNLLLHSLRAYRVVCNLELDKFKERKWRTEEEIQKLRAAISDNADFFEQIADRGPTVFGIDPADFQFIDIKEDFNYSDLHQLISALKSAARDWTALGDQERLETYSPILLALNEYVKKGGSVLIPGSGLSRLAVEIAAEGFHAISNEFAFVMIATTMLAIQPPPKPLVIHPFLHDLRGIDNLDSILVSSIFPSSGRCIKCLRSSLPSETPFHPIQTQPNLCTHLDPFQYLKDGMLQLSAGSFGGSSSIMQFKYDSVVTCYFIDTVDDFHQKVSEIYNILEDGGIWINFGPLLLHKVPSDFFSPLTQEDLIILAKRCGFQLIKNEIIRTSYGQNKKSHKFVQYDCTFSIYRK